MVVEKIKLKYSRPHKAHDLRHASQTAILRVSNFAF
jgi:hypothetical protein